MLLQAGKQAYAYRFSPTQKCKSFYVWRLLHISPRNTSICKCTRVCACVQKLSQEKLDGLTERHLAQLRIIVRAIRMGWQLAASTSNFFLSTPLGVTITFLFPASNNIYLSSSEKTMLMLMYFQTFHEVNFFQRMLEPLNQKSLSLSCLYTIGI